MLEVLEILSHALPTQEARPCCVVCVIYQSPITVVDWLSGLDRLVDCLIGKVICRLVPDSQSLRRVG